MTRLIIPPRERHPDVIAMRGILLMLMVGIGLALTPHSGPHSASAAQHAAVPISHPSATQTPAGTPTMRPALATAIAQGKRKAHLYWLFHVYLPKKHRQAALGGSHWQLPPLPTAQANAARNPIDARLMVQANPTYSVIAPPSASVDALQRALSAMGSPLATYVWYGPNGIRKTGAQYIYDSGVARGYDPAALVAWCHQESSCGRYGAAYDTQSIGNERPATTVGTPIECWGDGCYVFHRSWADGIEAFWDVIARYTHGQITGSPLTHVADIVPHYAPYGDGNDPPSYIAHVERYWDWLSSGAFGSQP